MLLYIMTVEKSSFLLKIDQNEQNFYFPFEKTCFRYILSNRRGKTSTCFSFWKAFEKVCLNPIPFKKLH